MLYARTIGHMLEAATEETMTRNRRRAVLAAFIATVALLATGCGSDTKTSATGEGTPTRGGTLNIADTSEAIDLNPFIAADNASEHVFAQIVEPLFRTNGQGDVVPWLATGIEPSDGNRTWTVTLRKGVTFSNGQPMTAADVVFSLNQVRKSPAWAAMFTPISGVRAASAGSVVITTKQPFGEMKVTLSLPFAAIVPKDYAGASAKEFDQHPIGTGPFELSKWDHGRTLTMVRNPDYWDPDRPYLDKIVWHAVGSNSSRALQLRGGKLDLIASPPASQVTSLEKTSGITVGNYALAYPDLLMFNEKDKLFANDQVREAAALAVDRAAVVKAALLGNGEPGGSWYAPALRYHDASIKPEEDATKAKKLLADVVKTTGLDPAVTMKIASGDEYARLASQIIQANLEAVGFKVQIQPLDSGALYEQLAKGKYQASLFGITSDIVDPSEVQGFYLGLDSFWTFADPTELQKLFDQALTEADAAKREDLYHQMQQWVADEKNLVVLDYRPWTWAMRDTVTGFDLAPTGVPWLAEAGFTD